MIEREHTAATGAERLAEWVREVGDLTTPERIVWCDGSREEWDRVTTALVEAGTFTRLNEEKSNSFWCASGPADVARIEERAFICTETEAGAGPDIAWMRFGEDGRLYAVNPEFGFFGVAPGTNWKTNPNAMRTIEKGNSLFTNVALTDDGDVWWEGLEGDPQHLTAWTGQDWTPDSDFNAAHPNSRYTTPISQCPVVAPEWDDPKGVPISAIVFGGRRADTVPLVAESRDWQHGVFVGATLSSEKTAAAAGKVGMVRRDPMAMLPFLGYAVSDYFQHWIDVGKGADASKLPRIFCVNWFRRGEDRRLLWPGFGENSRVLKWMIERIEGKAAAVETPVGYVPTPDQLDLDGLDTNTEDVAASLAVDTEEWQAELPLIEEWFAQIGDSLPSSMRDELDTLRRRLSTATHAGGGADAPRPQRRADGFAAPEQDNGAGILYRHGSGWPSSGSYRPQTAEQP